jgi:hypothetical protein
MTRAAVAVALAAGLFACGTDRGQPKPPPGAPAAASSSGPLPADQQCTWLNVCDKWTGCTHIARDGARWKVLTAERLAPGDLVDVLDVCSGDPVCMAASGMPKGESCTHGATTFVPEPDYTCAWTGTACVSRPKSPP